MGARAASNGLGSPEGSSGPLECGLCVSAIEETEERCQATCKAGCRSSFHLPCVTEAVEQAVRAGMGGSRQRKFGDYMLSKITKRPAEAVREWLRRPPMPVCPICHAAPLEAAHVHKPSAAKPARQAAPAPAAWAPAVHPLPRAGGQSAAGPRGHGHPWQGSSHSYKHGPAPAPARASSFAKEQERQFKEQQAQEARMRQQAAAKKQEAAAREAARAAAAKQGEAGQAAGQGSAGQAAVQQAGRDQAGQAVVQQAGQGQAGASAGAGAQVQQEAAVLLSEAALGLMRGRKRRECARSLRGMGFSVNECLQATLAWGGEVESAAAALLEGRAPPGLIATCVAREARELVEAGSLLGLAPVAVEAVLVALDGDWEQAQRQLRHQVEAALAAASAAALHASSLGSAGGSGMAAAVAVAGVDSLSRSASASASAGLTPAQAIYAYAGAYAGVSSDWGSPAADAVAAGQYASLETQALTTTSSWTVAGQQQGDVLQPGAGAGAEPPVEPAAADSYLAAADPYQPEPAIMSEDSARWWAGTSGGSAVGKAHRGLAAAAAALPGWSGAAAGVEQQQPPPPQQQQQQQQNDEAEVADLMELWGLGG